VNYLADIALGSFVGQGKRGYHLALEAAARWLAERDRTTGAAS
jgi:3-dehydroquinate dehydratase